MMKLRLLFLLGMAVFVFSCTGEKLAGNKSQSFTNLSSRSNSYLYNRDTTALMTPKMPEPVVQKNDLLHIRVFSQSVISGTDAPYNLYETPTPASSSTSSPATNAAPTAGFLVDNNGNIEYPQIGTLHIEGLTKEQVASLIKDKLIGMKALTNPSVIVRFLNYKVTVLGEVKNPNTITLPTDRVTILEALGMAGDVTEFGDRSKIKIARENNGVIEYGQLDLTKSDFFNSPYFRLKQNDVVFVQANERKLAEEDRKIRQEERQSVAQQIGIVTGVITSIALILNLIK
jgi:polysaccharide export outer membrane protein